MNKLKYLLERERERKKRLNQSIVSSLIFISSILKNEFEFYSMIIILDCSFVYLTDSWTYL